MLKESIKRGWANSSLAARWQAQTPRDQLALTLLGIFLLLVLLYVLVWQPAMRNLDAARESYQQERELYQYLKANAERVSGLPSETVQPLEASQLQGAVARTAVEHGLVLERLDNEGGGRVQVTVQEASFTDLLAWWSELEERGVRLANVSLDRAGEGKVLARLALQVD